MASTSTSSSTLLSLSNLFFISPTPIRFKASPSLPWKQKPHRRRTPLRCQKMYVPGFGEASPEAKAGKNLHNFFTYVAVRIVLAQLESYNPEAYRELMEFVERNSLNDGDEFCANLMRESSRHKGLGGATLLSLRDIFVPITSSPGAISSLGAIDALRILEVRSAYCKNDFEWDNLKRLASKIVDESNTRLMRDYVLETSHDVENGK
ncbi:hypothetical protein Scep_012772 [Stephania cephalantha]|uniref:Chaperonin-like RBCX protein 1, chloroplastic n=1 Tax=Stephania cephalantha TaxID=152367 RepID=A0AAP0JFQ2_9MAGN